MTNITAHRGDDETYVFTVTSSSSGQIDLNGADARFTAKVNSRDSDDDAVIVKTTGDGIDIFNPQNQITVTLAAADTINLIGTHYLYDLQVTSGGKTSTVATGLLRLRRDVSVTAP